jgi:hypothetical protein
VISQFKDCGMCGKCDSSVLGLRHVRDKSILWYLREHSKSIDKVAPDYAQPWSLMQHHVQRNASNDLFEANHFLTKLMSGQSYGHACGIVARGKRTKSGLSYGHACGIVVRGQT